MDNIIKLDIGNHLGIGTALALGTKLELDLFVENGRNGKIKFV